MTASGNRANRRRPDRLADNFQRPNPLRGSPPDTKSVRIICPAPPRSNSGNRVRALRYQAILRRLGANVRINRPITRNDDLAIVINAYRSAQAVYDSRQSFPHLPLIVVVTGTDLYRHGTTAAFHQSLELADRIVVAQPTMKLDLPQAFHAKCQVIFQSAQPPSVPRPLRPRHRKVVVCGHLRAVKDPFRTAMAVRALPADSAIRVEHYGAALQSAYSERANREMQRNARYHWHGEITRGEARRKLAAAWLMVLSSKMEGGANVLSEAIAAGTPVLASHIPGTVGLLGHDYPGYFDVGATRQLRELLRRCETDQRFYGQLTLSVARRARFVSVDRETAAWKALLEELETTRSTDF